MNGVVWVPVLCSPLFVAVWSCLAAAKRDDVDLASQEAGLCGAASWADDEAGEEGR